MQFANLAPFNRDVSIKVRDLPRPKLPPQTFKRAIELDPNFAMAYASLGLAYAEHSEKDSTVNYRIAYELRDRVSERERFYIESHYYESVAGNLEKARQVYEVWAKTYPRDDIAHYNLSGCALNLGDFEKAEEEAKKTLKLLRGDCRSYGTLISAYISMNRLAEAHAVPRKRKSERRTVFISRSIAISLPFWMEIKSGWREWQTH